MSTITLINQEVKTLSNDQQKKVLAFVELLKYRASLRQVEQLAMDLGGVRELVDDDIRTLLKAAGAELEGDWSIEELRERIDTVEQVAQALARMKAGNPGISQLEMKERVRQWQSK